MIELNKIYNDDCMVVLKTIQDKTIDLVITDPPYLNDLKRFGSNWTSESKIANSKMYSKDSPVMKEMSDFTEDKCTAMLEEVKRVMKLMNAYFFCNDALVGTYCSWAKENKFKVNILTWNKPLSILNRNRYSTNCEFIVRIHTSSGTALNKIDFDKYPEYSKYYSKYQAYPQIRGKNKLHPCQKPYELIKGYVVLSSNEGDLILDPYCGSGTVPLVCKEANRNYIGVEKNNEYFNVAVKRLGESNV